ncbi:MAG: hypothetical protein GXP47_05550 [Acidobacteria bacterium]|nr:hypothetical protein [Acidobacteriota bacterium]
MVENQRREKDRDLELAMILGSIGFGLVMLGRAARRAQQAQGGEPAEPRTDQ